VPEQTILVLGCGMAGVAAARDLRRLLPHQRVVVVDRSPRASYPPSHAALAVGEVRARSLLRSRARLARRGIEFINAEVQHKDMPNKQVRAEGRELRYDYLVIALGSESALETIPGLSEAAQGFYSFDAAERLGASLRYFAGGRILITVPAGPMKWAPAPYEMAMLLEHHFHGRKMRQKVEIGICAPDPAPLSTLGDEASEMIAGQLAHKGIEFSAGSRLASVDSSRHVAHFDDGSERAFDLLVAIPPQVAGRIVAETGLVDESGRVRVHPVTLESEADSVFAIGDVAGLRSSDGTLVSPSADLARRMASAAARQIAARIAGGAPPGPPDGRARWFVEVGAGAATMLSGDFIREPRRIRASQPSIVWHWAKSLTEKYWLYRVW
jgi:sulfide:quinone oxidoreductase